VGERGKQLDLYTQNNLLISTIYLCRWWKPTHISNQVLVMKCTIYYTLQAKTFLNSTHFKRKKAVLDLLILSWLIIEWKKVYNLILKIIFQFIIWFFRLLRAKNKFSKWNHFNCKKYLSPLFCFKSLKKRFTRRKKRQRKEQSRFRI